MSMVTGARTSTSIAAGGSKTTPTGSLGAADLLTLAAVKDVASM